MCSANKAALIFPQRNSVFGLWVCCLCVWGGGGDKSPPAPLLYLCICDEVEVTQIRKTRCRGLLLGEPFRTLTDIQPRLLSSASESSANSIQLLACTTFNRTVPHGIQVLLFRIKQEEKCKNNAYPLLNAAWCCALKNFPSSLQIITTPTSSQLRARPQTGPHAAALPTYEQVPLRVQVGLIGQAALHDVEAVVVAGPHSGESSAVRAVEHLHQGADAPWGGADLQIYQKEKEKSLKEGCKGENHATHSFSLSLLLDKIVLVNLQQKNRKLKEPSET